MEYPVLASSSTLNLPAPVDLLAGSAELITNRATVGAADVAQYQVVTLDEDGLIVAYDPAAETAQVAYITAVPAAAGDECPYYTAGDFNHEKLVWPAGITTLAQRKAVFAGTMIAVSTILK